MRNAEWPRAEMRACRMWRYLLDEKTRTRPNCGRSTICTRFQLVHRSSFVHGELTRCLTHVSYVELDVFLTFLPFRSFRFHFLWPTAKECTLFQWAQCFFFFTGGVAFDRWRIISHAPTVSAEMFLLHCLMSKAVLERQVTAETSSIVSSPFHSVTIPVCTLHAQRRVEFLFWECCCCCRR